MAAAAAFPFPSPFSTTATGNRFACSNAVIATTSVGARIGKRWIGGGYCPNFLLKEFGTGQTIINQRNQISSIMGQAKRPTCPECGAFLILALPPGGQGKRTLQCLDCDRPDPLMSEAAMGWLKSELEPPKRN